MIKNRLFKPIVLFTGLLVFPAFNQAEQYENAMLNLSDRDPFSLPALTAYCPVNQNEAFNPLKDWRLLGVIGQEDRWQSWVTNQGHEWIMLKKGDRLPDANVTVATITQFSAEFNPFSTSQSYCRSPIVLKLGFQE